MVDLRLSLENVEDYAWLDLDESKNESVDWREHPSLIPHIPELLGAALAIVAAIIGSIYFIDRLIEQPRLFAIPVIVIIASLLGAASIYIRVKSTFYVITSERVVKKEGLPYINTTTKKSKLDKVQNPTLKQGFIQKRFDLGDVHLATAGTGEVEMHMFNVPGPQEPETLLTQRS